MCLCVRIRTAACTCLHHEVLLSATKYVLIDRTCLHTKASVPLLMFVLAGRTYLRYTGLFLSLMTRLHLCTCARSWCVSESQGCPSLVLMMSLSFMLADCAYLRHNSLLSITHMCLLLHVFVPIASAFLRRMAFLPSLMLGLCSQAVCTCLITAFYLSLIAHLFLRVRARS